MDKKTKYTVEMYTMYIASNSPFKLKNSEQLRKLIIRNKSEFGNAVPMTFDFNTLDEAQSKFESLKSRLYYFFDSGVDMFFDINTDKNLLVDEYNYLVLNIIELKKTTMYMDWINNPDEDELLALAHADIPFN